jgi:hypothetical protein
MMSTMPFAALLLLAVAACDETIGAECIGCHPSIAARYRTSPMANALGPVETRELVGLAAVREDDTGFEYRFEVPPTPESKSVTLPARIVESWRDPRANSGDWLPISSSPLVFAIGAGKRDRSFAAKQGELVWFAPLEAMRDADSGVFHATLAPGESIDRGSRFSTPIAPECLRCHTDAPPPGDYPGNVAPPATYVPRGIGCGACHADSQAHATWQSAAAAGEQHSGADLLLPAEPEDPIASVSTCARCHLQGDAHIALAEPWRTIPAPATDLLATRAVFDAAHPTDEIGFVSHVQRMVMSRCFTASLANHDESATSSHPARAMTCTTCHDPHAGGYDGFAEHRARSGCSVCHPSDATRVAGRASPCSRPMREEDVAGTDCVSCHMRATGTFDLSEVVIHDHRIVRKPPPPSPAAPLRAKEAKDGELAPFTWPGRPKPAWIGDAGVWTMAYASLGNAERALAFAERDPGETSARIASYHHIRGSVLERAGKTGAALAAYERALALDPTQAETAVNLGALLGRTGDTKRALEVLSTVIERHPMAEGALRNRAIVRMSSGDAAGGAADLDAAFQIRPQASVARALAQHWAQVGAAKLARQWADRAAELDPRAGPPR